MVKFLVIRHTLSAIIIERHSSQNINRSIFHSPKCIDTILIIFVVFLVSFYFCTKYFYGCTTGKGQKRHWSLACFISSTEGFRIKMLCCWMPMIPSGCCSVTLFRCLYRISLQYFQYDRRELIVIISRIDYWFRLSSNRSFNPFFLVFFFSCRSTICPLFRVRCVAQKML